MSTFLPLFVLFALLLSSLLTPFITLLIIPPSIPLRTYPANYLPKKHSAPALELSGSTGALESGGFCPHLLEMAGNSPKMGLGVQTLNTNVPTIIVTRPQPSTLHADLNTSNSGSRPGQRPPQPPLHLGRPGH